MVTAKSTVQPPVSRLKPAPPARLPACQPTAGESERLPSFLPSAAWLGGSCPSEARANYNPVKTGPSRPAQQALLPHEKGRWGTFKKGEAPRGS